MASSNSISIANILYSRYFLPWESSVPKDLYQSFLATTFIKPSITNQLIAEMKRYD
jgi:hypothetical protein